MKSIDRAIFGLLNLFSAESLPLKVKLIYF